MELVGIMFLLVLKLIGRCNDMREFYLNPSQYNKWEYQQRENKKECCWCEYMCDGVLVDNFLIYCKKGLALLQEHYVNPWQSDYYVMFARYDDKDGTDMIWDIFEKRIDYDDE